MHYMGLKQQDQGKKNHFWKGRVKSCRNDPELPHKLSENVWFVWSKRSYSGDKEGCHACGRTDDGRRTECEDRAGILETEFAIEKCSFYSFA